LKSLAQVVFEILRSKRNGFTSLTFQGQVTSSVTWPFDSPYFFRRSRYHFANQQLPLFNNYQLDSSWRALSPTALFVRGPKSNHRVAMS